MEENQNLSQIEKIGQLIEDFPNYIKELQKRFLSEIKSTLDKFTSKINLIEINNKEETTEESSIKEKRRQIENLVRSISQQTKQLGNQIKQNISNFLFDIVGNKLDNLSRSETNSNKELSDKSFTEDLSSDLEFEFNYSKENFNYINQELIKDLSNVSVSSINENNSDTNNNNFNSNSSDLNDNIRNFLKCSIHKDKNAEWQSKNDPTINLCNICYRIYGNVSEYGELIRISDRIASNSSYLPKNFKNATKDFLINIAKKLTHLFNRGLFPEIEERDNEEEKMKEFITKVCEEHKKIVILDENTNKANEFLLTVFKNISLSNRIILQSAKINIFKEIKNHSKFSIIIYPHRNLVNKTELIGLIHDDLEFKWNINYNITEGHVFIIVNEFFGNENHKKIYECKEKEILKFINILNEMNNLKNNFFINACKINENRLEPKYDAPNFNSDKIEKIGGEIYCPPFEYFGIGINNVINKDNSAIAYISFSQKYTNEDIRIILHVTIEDNNLDVLVCKKENNALDKRHRNKIGTGIYLFQDINKAEKYAGVFDINGKKYKILLMAKVKQDKIKESENKNGLWIVDKEFVKIYRIILREIFS